MYDAWFLRYETQSSFSFWTIFCPLSPLTTWKIKILKKWKKKTRDIHHFTLVYLKWQSYDVWFLEIWRSTDRFFCHFGLFFAPIPPNKPQNQNYEKIKKHVYHKWKSYHAWFLRYGMLDIFFHFGAFFALLHY